MLKRLVLIVVTLAVLPVVITLGLYLYRVDQQKINTSYLTLVKEVEMSAESIGEFINERASDVKLWSLSSTASVALDFQRPEGLEHFLSSVIADSQAYESVYILDKKYDYFTSSLVGGDRMSLDHLVAQLPEFVSVAKRIKNNDFGIYLLGKDNLDLFVVSRIRDSYNSSLGFIVAKINPNKLQRYLNRVYDHQGSFFFNRGAVFIKKKSDIIQTQDLKKFNYCSNFTIMATDYSLCVKPVNDFVRSDLWSLVLWLSFFLFVFIIIFKWTAEKIVKKALNPFEALLKVMNEASKGNTYRLEPSSPYPEIRQIEETSSQILERLELFRVNSEKAAADAAVGRIASQVSHDIRSPLSALEMISTQLNELSEEKRVIIRNSINRIRDIANTLLKKKVVNSIASQLSINTNNNEMQIELLMPVIDSLVSEKRLQYRDLIHVEINFSQSVDSYGLFSKIDVNEFKRIVSNLINNSVESFLKHSGSVNVLLYGEANHNVISIVDNGVGIPVEIFKKIGLRGVTFNKAGGSGLGLHHAITTIETMGGSIEIDSKINSGTVINIRLPRMNAPQWFVPCLNIVKNKHIVILDDDQSIHQIWKGRFEAQEGQNFQLVNFGSSNDFRSFYRKNFQELSDSLYLMDYEILNHNETGLDLIEELGIQDQSILVTSRYEENSVRERCKKLGVRLIPKSMSGFIPIQIDNS